MVSIPDLKFRVQISARAPAILTEVLVVFFSPFRQMLGQYTILVGTGREET
jgi:hypothetical protein